MKKVELVTASEVEVKPFHVSDFIERAPKRAFSGKVSKKELKHLAKELGLVYSDETLLFAKKLLEAYMAKR